MISDFGSRMYPGVRTYQLEILNTSLPETMIFQPHPHAVKAQNTNLKTTSILKPPWMAKDADVWVPVGPLLKLVEDAIAGKPSYTPWLRQTIPCAPNSSVICSKYDVFQFPNQI